MIRKENDLELTERMSALHRDYQLVEHYRRNGQLEALFGLLDHMKIAIDQVQFRLNDLKFTP